MKIICMHFPNLVSVYVCKEHVCLYLDKLEIVRRCAGKFML